MTDAEIIKKLKKRDEEALVHLQREYENYCYHIAISFLEEEEAAMECVNEVYMAIWSCKEAPENLKAYLAKVTRNTALQYLRKNSAQKRAGRPVLLDELAQCLTDPKSGSDFEGRLLRGFLNDFVRSLPQEERYVFLQRYWYGLSIEELALNLSWREAKVKSMLFRIRKKLKKCLTKEGYCV